MMTKAVCPMPKSWFYSVLDKESLYCENIITEVLHNTYVSLHSMEDP